MHAPTIVYYIEVIMFVGRLVRILKKIRILRIMVLGEIEYFWGVELYNLFILLVDWYLH